MAQQGDTQAQEQLVQNNLGYIRKTANELYISVGLGNSELGIDHDDLIQEGSIGLLRAISLYDPGKKIKFLTYAGPAIRNAMMDLISAAFATFEQRMQSDKDGIPMERINLDDLLPGEDPMQRSDLIADPYASEPEKIMEEAENRKELYEGLRRIRERERVYLLYRFGFEDDIEHPLVGTACTSILARAVQGQPKHWRWTIYGWSCHGGISAFRCGGTKALIYLCFLFRAGRFCCLANSDFVRGCTKSACPTAAEKCLSTAICPHSRWRSQSLSSVSRKQRYNTLDFPMENRVPTGMLLAPIGNPEQRGYSPLDNLLFWAAMILNPSKRVGLIAVKNI